MTRHLPPPDMDRSGDAWIVGLLAGCSLLAGLLALVIATRPQTGRLVSDITRAEIALVQPDDAMPAPASGPARLAARQ